MDCLLIVIIIISPFLYHPFYVVVVVCEVDCGWGTLRIEVISIFSCATKRDIVILENSRFHKMVTII